MKSQTFDGTPISFRLVRNYLLSLSLLFTSASAWAVNATLLDDTFVGSHDPDTAHDTWNVLQANNSSGDIKRIYLRFTVTAAQMGGSTAAPKSATLKLTKSSGQAATVSVHSADNNWSGAINWGNKPRTIALKKWVNTAQVPIVAPVPDTNGGTVEFDVTDYISGPGEYSFCVMTNATWDVMFRASNFGAGAPVLELTPATVAADLTRKPSIIRRLSQDYLDRYSAWASGGSNDINRIGFFNVKKAPYYAKGDGSTDDTLAIQRAVNEARDSRMAVFFPAGTYLVSDTIQCVQGIVTEDDNPYTATFEERWNQREFANILIGPSAGGRAIIKLKGRSKGFGKKANGAEEPSDQPKPVLHVWSRGKASYSLGPLENQYDININQTVSNIDIDLTGAQNPTAIGIDMAGAQGTSMSSMTITAHGAHAGITGLPGPGGSTADVTINGGKYGIDAHSSGAEESKRLRGLAPLLQHCFINSDGDSASAFSIRWNGVGAMVLVGCKISGRGIFIGGGAKDTTPHRGNLNIADSVIELELTSAGPAVTGSRSVYMRNVYCKNVNSPANISTAGIETGGDDSSPASESISDPSSWHLIKEYYDGAKLIQYQDNSDPAKFTPSYIDSKYQAVLSLKLSVTTASGGVPAGFLDRHRWTTPQPLPVWASSPNAPAGGLPVLNVKDFGAVGDGDNDDTQAIQNAINAATGSTKKAVFIPAGEYLLYDTLQLRPDTVLFGLNKNICRLKASKGGGNPNSTDFGGSDIFRPLVQSALGTDASNDTTTMAELTLFQGMATTQCYLLRWEAGAHSAIQNVNFDRHYVANNNQADIMAVPLVKVQGTGGGKWYNFWVDGSLKQGPGYRHFQLERTTAALTNEALTFYMFCPETDVANTYCAEFIKSWNIDVFQSKFEGKNSPSLNMIGCKQFRWFGFTGNAYVPEGSHSIGLTNCYNFLLAGQSYQYNTLPEAIPPDTFFRVKDTFVTEDNPRTWTTPGEEKFVVYRRGTVVDPQ